MYCASLMLKTRSSDENLRFRTPKKPNEVDETNVEHKEREVPMVPTDKSAELMWFRRSTRWFRL
jgi:hypothetical protein